MGEPRGKGSAPDEDQDQGREDQDGAGGGKDDGKIRDFNVERNLRKGQQHGRHRPPIEEVSPAKEGSVPQNRNTLPGAQRVRVLEFQQARVRLHRQRCPTVNETIRQHVVVTRTLRPTKPESDADKPDVHQSHGEDQRQDGEPLPEAQLGDLLGRCGRAGFLRVIFRWGLELVRGREANRPGDLGQPRPQGFDKRQLPGQISCEARQREGASEDEPGRARDSLKRWTLRDEQRDQAEEEEHLPPRAPRRVLVNAKVRSSKGEDDGGGACNRR